MGFIGVNRHYRGKAAWFRYLAVLVFWFLAKNGWAGEGMDIFPGTLVIWHDQPVLIRCDLVKNAYILVDGDMQTSSYVEQIRKLSASLESPVSAVISGSYRNVGGKNYLVVQSIKTIRKGSSCHLIPPEEPLNIEFSKRH